MSIFLPNSKIKTLAQQLRFGNNSSVDISTYLLENERTWLTLNFPRKPLLPNVALGQSRTPWRTRELTNKVVFLHRKNPSLLCPFLMRSATVRGVRQHCGQAVRCRLCINTSMDFALNALKLLFQCQSALPSLINITTTTNLIPVIYARSRHSSASS